MGNDRIPGPRGTGWLKSAAPGIEREELPVHQKMRVPTQRDCIQNRSSCVAIHEAAKGIGFGVTRAGHDAGFNFGIAPIIQLVPGAADPAYNPVPTRPVDGAGLAPSVAVLAGTVFARKAFAGAPPLVRFKRPGRSP